MGRRPGPRPHGRRAPNTHVISHGGRTLATVESGPLPYELSDELDTLGPCDFSGTLPGGFAAHTKLDVRSGELHADRLLLGLGPRPARRRRSAEGLVTSTTDIPVVDAPMIHDFALTETSSCCFDLPVTFSMTRLSRPARRCPTPGTGTTRRGSGSCRVGRDGDVRWIDVDPCFVFHTLNAYDDNGPWSCSTCAATTCLRRLHPGGPGPVTLDVGSSIPAGGKVTSQRLDDRHQEFPRIDDRRTGRRHRYGYSAVIGEGIEAIVAWSTASSPTCTATPCSSTTSNGTPSRPTSSATARRPGEFVFVPPSSDAREDDGYLMGFVHDPERGAADLVILSAQDFSGEPVARVHLPSRIPLGFHGNWVADV